MYVCDGATYRFRWAINLFVESRDSLTRRPGLKSSGVRRGILLTNFSNNNKSVCMMIYGERDGEREGIPPAKWTRRLVITITITTPHAAPQGPNLLRISA